MTNLATRAPSEGKLRNTPQRLVIPRRTPQVQPFFVLYCFNLLLGNNASRRENAGKGLSRTPLAATQCPAFLAAMGSPFLEPVMDLYFDA
jgi:hypothetical protein